MFTVTPETRLPVVGSMAVTRSVQDGPMSRSGGIGMSSACATLYCDFASGMIAPTLAAVRMRQYSNTGPVWLASW